jgi:hypothetical protein
MAVEDDREEMARKELGSGKKTSECAAVRVRLKNPLPGYD